MIKFSNIRKYNVKSRKAPHYEQWIDVSFNGVLVGSISNTPPNYEWELSWPLKEWIGWKEGTIARFDNLKRCKDHVVGLVQKYKA